MPLLEVASRGSSGAKFATVTEKRPEAQVMELKRIKKDDSFATHVNTTTTRMRDAINKLGDDL